MSTELANKPERQSDIRSLIQSDRVREQLFMALPKYFTPEQFAVIARTSINKNPKLLECTPESFMVALLTAAQMGIPCDGRRGHLVPRWSNKLNAYECNFQPDYKGLTYLIRLDPNVNDVYAVVVREGDTFVLKQGLHRDLIHEPNPFGEGELKGVYAVINYKDGSLPSFTWLNRKDVEAVRAHSDSWKAHLSKKYDTPWISDEAEMWKKTAINRIAKTADLSPETHERLTSAVNVESEVLPSRATPQIERPQISTPQLASGSTESEPGVNTTTEKVEPVAKQEPAPTADKPPKKKLERVAKEPAKTEAKQEPASEVKEAGVISFLDTQKQREAEKKEALSIKSVLKELGVTPIEAAEFAKKHTGNTDQEVIGIAVENKWCEGGEHAPKTLSDFSEEMLISFLEDWHSVSGWIAKSKEAN